MLVLFDLLSTNVTSFFRDPAHFAFLERELYAPLAHGTLAVPGRKLRLWSAACSTGAEPYSLAMQALELLPPAMGFDVKIIATDLSTRLSTAAAPQPTTSRNSLAFRPNDARASCRRSMLRKARPQKHGGR